MNYPLISDYIEAIKSAEDNFKELTNLRPVLGDDGQPIMASGNFAVVFKMEDEQSGKLYAIKCFTKEQEGRAEAYKQIAEELKDVDSPYLVSIRYLDKELFVDTDQTDETEFPVLLMDWVEGKPMDKYLRDNLDDKYALEILAYRFSLLAQWLIPQPFAHGDLKPDNILVREDGTLVLVDYDGMYVSAMKGQKARELGSPDFRHPLRDVYDFDEHLDDFPITSILLSLKVLSIEPQFLKQFGVSNGLLLSVDNYRSINNSKLFNKISPSSDGDVNLLVGLLYILLAKRNVIITQKSLFELSIPFINTEEPVQYNEDWILDDGIRYTSDKKYVLGVYGKEPPCCPYNICSISKDSKIICDNAFNLFSDNNKSWLSWDSHDRPSVCISDIEIPSNIIVIGEEALANIHDPYYASISIRLNEGLIIIKNFAFANSDIESIEIPSSVSSIGEGAFISCKKMKNIKLPETIKTISSRMFQGCESIDTFLLPPNLKKIDSYAFSGCKSLNKIIIPSGVKSIGDYAFSDCENLKELSLPKSLLSIGKCAFSGCKNLEKLSIPSHCKDIGDDAFYKCYKLPNIKLPNGQLIEHYTGEERKRELIKQLSELK